MIASNHLILCHPPLLLPSIFSSIRVFSNESILCIRWPKYWSFSFSISPSNEYSGLISFRIDWIDLLPFQGTLKSLLEHHNFKASAIKASAFSLPYGLSHPYTTTGKTIALTIWTFVSKVEVKVLVAQLCLGPPIDCSPPDSSVHGILQTRLLEWVAIPFSRGSSQTRD